MMLEKGKTYDFNVEGDIVLNEYDYSSAPRIRGDIDSAERQWDDEDINPVIVNI